MLTFTMILSPFIIGISFIPYSFYGKKTDTVTEIKENKDTNKIHDDKVKEVKQTLKWVSLFSLILWICSGIFSFITRKELIFP
jgi:hypothetical protein